MFLRNFIQLFLEASCPHTSSILFDKRQVCDIENLALQDQLRAMSYQLIVDEMKSRELIAEVDKNLIESAQLLF